MGVYQQKYSFKFLLTFLTTTNSPKLANKIEVMKLSSEIETTSPIEAANGVARLSGLTLYLFERRITATSTKSKWKKDNKFESNN